MTEREQLIITMLNKWFESSDGSPLDEHIRRMGDVLEVAVEAMLVDSTDSEREPLNEKHGYFEFRDAQGGVTKAFLADFLANRRTRYTRKLTPQERVTIEPSNGATIQKVYLDRKFKISFADPEDAKIYRLGLISKLEAESKNEN